MSYQTNHKAYLAQHKLPAMAFAQEVHKYESLEPVWAALRGEENRRALKITKQALQEQRLFPAEERAALMVALAYAEIRAGSVDNARRMAGRSLDLFPNQWAAHRILLTVLAMQQECKAAYMHLVMLNPGRVPTWDEPLPRVQINVALAAWSWILGEWEVVADHLTRAFPNGVATMPPELQEDWFRLALYRERPQDAVAAASLLIEQQPVDTADKLLQTIVQNGWTAEALPLYRVAYASAPNSQLLRRRLVALCIREGALEEARTLSKPGALGLAA